MVDKSSTIERLKEQFKSISQLLDELDVEKKAEQPTSDATYPGELSYRVIHLRNNPIESKIKAKKFELQKLKEENAKLKARLELLESGDDHDVSRRIDDFVNSSDQIEVLSRRVNELQEREDKILDSFGKVAREVREVCYLLTGYRVDTLKDHIYRLSNMYAEQEEDKLLFEICPDETVQLLQNEYSDRLSEFIRTHLENSDSFPAFLASLTLDLFKSTSQSADMSVTMDNMDTTILPNPNF